MKVLFCCNSLISFPFPFSLIIHLNPSPLSLIGVVSEIRPVWLTLVHTALVIRALFIRELAYSHRKNGSKMTIFKSKMDFLRIQDLRFKMTERIYRE